MKHFLTIMLLIAAMGVSFAQTTSSVTFKVNMGPAASRGIVNVQSDVMYLAGSMNGWTNNSIPMERDNSTTDTVYTVTLDNMVVDSIYEYKFVANASTWELLENDDNIHRKYQVKADANDNILPAAYFSDDSTYPEFPVKAIKVSFRVNMELEIAKGAFDPAVDRISLRTGYNGWQPDVSVFKKPLTGTIFTFDTTFNFIPGRPWDYVYTYQHGAAITWEAPSNTWLEITEDEYAAGESIETRYFSGRDTNSTMNGYSVYFSVDVTDAKADIGGTLSDFPNGIKRIAIFGGDVPLAWPGQGWPDQDTVVAKWLNDNGENGDLVAGDNIWSAKLDFLKGSALHIPYRYGINYGMPGDNGGSNDNEKFVDNPQPPLYANHWATIPIESQAVRVHDVWGVIGETIVTGVVSKPDNQIRSYKLDQNYPNPFNPSTVIKYSVPEAGLVTLKVFNVLGQEVATLVNEVQQASENTVNFDASNLTSGLYMYQITAKNFTATKKMMLIK